MNTIFAKLTAGRDELRSIDVPEIETTIYYRPMSLLEEKQMAGPGGRMTVETVARIVCRLSLDKTGKRLFEDEHEPALLASGDRHLLIRIARAITGEAMSVASAEGN